MTLLWFIVWFIADVTGESAPLELDPVNVWTGGFILAAALDLARQHAPAAGSARRHKE